MERRLAAVLLTDIVGYSRLMEVDEEATIARQRVHRATVIDPKIESFGGRIVKSTGDGILAEFGSVVKAVSCAIETQKAISDLEADVSQDRQINYRIGINLGDVVVDGDDILGDGVNVAARLEGIAPPGGICLSDSAHDQIVNRANLQFEDGGDRLLKNISRPIRVWYWSPLNGQMPATSMEVSADLKQPSKPSVAVMPFANLSADADQGYFAEGITDDIIAALSRVRWLFVIARSSSYAFQDREIDARAIARDLGVRYVLGGSVRKSGNRIRVSASLTDPEAAKQLWADSYDGTIDDIFDFQDRVTSEIVSTLQPNLLDAEADRSSRLRPADLACWDYVVRARPHLWSWDAENCEIAKGLLQEALQIDPDYGLAHSMLSYVSVVSAWQGWDDDLETCIGTSLRESERAIEIDPADSWAYIALGMSYGLQRRNSEAIQELERAITLDPNSALAHAMLGMVRCWGGDGDGGVTAFDVSLRSNPRDPFNRAMGAMYATAHFVEGRYDECAIAALETARKMPKLVGAWRAAAAAQAMLNRTEEAKQNFAKVKQLQPKISTNWTRAQMPWTEGEHLDRWIEGLRRAGME